jgi:hypothetical protein
MANCTSVHTQVPAGVVRSSALSPIRPVRSRRVCIPHTRHEGRIPLPFHRMLPLRWSLDMSLTRVRAVTGPQGTLPANFKMTKTIDDELNPTWDEMFEFPVHSLTVQELVIEVSRSTPAPRIAEHSASKSGALCGWMRVEKGHEPCTHRWKDVPTISPLPSHIRDTILSPYHTVSPRPIPESFYARRQPRIDGYGRVLERL